MVGEEHVDNYANAASDEIMFVTDLFHVFQRYLGFQFHGQGVHADAI